MNQKVLSVVAMKGIGYLRPLKLFFHKNMSFNWINLLLSGLLPSLVLMIVPFF
jgi:hypothetical protein